MKGIVKSVIVVGQVISLIAGNKTTTATNYVIEQNPYIALF